MTDRPPLAGWLSAVLSLALFLSLSVASPSRATADAGTLSGRVETAEGVGLAGVTVSIREATTITDADGRYVLDDLAPGNHELLLALGERSARDEAIRIEAGGVTERTTVVDWQLLFGEVLTVRAASRYAQRIVEAPAPVVSLSLEEIAQRSGHGQLPRLFAATASAELAQGGLFDFNLNTRGFNGSTNRRLLTLIDGRDPSLAVFSGSQEWATLSFGLERLASAELVRGPGAALYGAGAYNGVLDLRTRPVRSQLGGSVRATRGELDTTRLEIRHARGDERLGHFEVQAGAQRSDDFLRSRVDGAEYRADAIPPETIAPPRDEVELWVGELRYGRDLGAALSLALEGGTGRARGATVVTGVGRLQRLDVARPWARFDLSSPRWTVLASYTGRDSDGEVSLATGAPIYLDSSRTAVEAQANREFAGGRGHWVGGISWSRLEVDSADPDGAQTLFEGPVSSEHEAVFGQGELALGSRLRVVASLRWDDSDLHEARWSPRGAMVLALGANRSLRLTYSEAFQSPTLSEKNVRVAVAPPLDLSPLEEALAPLLGGVSLGLESVPLLAVGSEDLDAEEISSWELGYGGTIGRRAFLSASLYRSELSNFTTNLVPVLGTSLGQLVSPVLWQPPSSLSPEAADAVRAALAQALPPTFLVAAAGDGSPYVPLLSFGSFGRVETEGAEVDVRAELGAWQLDAGVSWFDYEVDLEAAENPVAPNRASWQVGLGVARRGERFDVALDWRWSDAFDYRSGVFVGPVPSYSVLDLTVDVPLGPRWGLDLAVANVLDDEHYEAFGGDLLTRRALLSATCSW